MGNHCCYHKDKKNQEMRKELILSEVRKYDKETDEPSVFETIYDQDIILDSTIRLKESPIL